VLRGDILGGRRLEKESITRGTREDRNKEESGHTLQKVEGELRAKKVDRE